MSDFSASQSQSQAYAAALQRAKQIAAKIQPNQVPQMGPGSVGVGVGGSGGGSVGGGGGGGGSGYKRSHEDSDSGPDSKRFTSPGSDYGSHNNSNMSSGSTGAGGGGGGGGSGLGNGAPNLSQARAQAAAVAARLAAVASTTCEEQIRIPDSIVNAFAGRNGNDTISHIQAESGCKVQLSQDNEQICTLRGSRETVTKGREMLQQMANRNGGGTVEVVLTINMPPPGATGCPQFQELMIPGTKVGLVIGKGGDTIKQLQEKTGAKMVIIQDGPNQEVIKPLRITGDPQKIEHAKQLVLELIAQKDAQAQQQGARNNTNMGTNNGSGGFNAFGEQCEVFVPKVAVGVVIGKGGDMIRKIQTECGCKLQFIPGKNDEPGDRRCLIQGTRQQVEDAKRMIDGLIENVMQRNQGNRNANGNNGNMDNGNSNYGYGYGVNHAQQPPREEITFMVPASKCGIVIGRGGETIKLINQQSGAYCEMDRNAVNPPAEKLFKCKGTSEQVEAARQMIAEKINMDIQVISRKPINGSGPLNSQQGQQASYPNAMQADPNTAYQQQQWAASYAQQGWGDPQQQQQMVGAAGIAQAAATGSQQADYSAQWIEYYKSVGMHREAEMVEQQMKAKQAASATGNAGQQISMGMQPQQPQQQAQAAGGQTDYSAQWAEYYRSIGKIDEAEAIEKQMKQNQNAQANNSAANTNNHNNNSNSVANAGSNAGGTGGTAGSGAIGGGGAGSGMQQAQPGYPQGMTPSQYAQYSQYYAAAAAAGAGAPGGYTQQAYGGYGTPSAGYPGAPQPGVMPGGIGGSNTGGGSSSASGGNNNAGGPNSNSHQKQKNDKN